MKWLALVSALIHALANISGLLRDRRAWRSGWGEAVAKGLEAADERARRAEAAAARSRADPDLLRDDGHRRISLEALERTCSAWPYVGWSSRDTPATIADAKASNAARTAFCEED